MKIMKARLNSEWENWCKETWKDKVFYTSFLCLRMYIVIVKILCTVFITDDDLTDEIESLIFAYHLLLSLLTMI